jgi:hypothetical protein
LSPRSVLAVLINAVFTLGDDNIKSLGHWIDGNWAGISKTATGIVTAVATYLFGRRAGRRVAKTEAYSSAIGTAEGLPTGADVAVALRKQAKDHNLPLAS